MNFNIKPATDSDLDFVLSLNQKSLSAVSHSNLEKMKHFLNISSYFKIMHINDIPVGFIIGLLPGKDYASENYVWINERYTAAVGNAKCIHMADNGKPNPHMWPRSSARSALQNRRQALNDTAIAI